MQSACDVGCIVFILQYLQMATSLIAEKDIAKNSNAQFGLTLELQQHLASQNTQFMIDIARQMKFGYTVPSLALHISTLFFHKKSYINFDRLLILSASFLIASKLKSIDCRIKALCNSLYNIVNYRTNGMEPFNQDKMKKLKEYISIYENQILRTLEFDIDPVTPHDFLKKECEILYVSERDVNRKIFSTTRVLIIDSYRSRCSLVFPPLVIFVACFLIASRYEGRKPWQSQVVRAAIKEESPSEEKCYEVWLGMLSAREEQEIPATSIRDCIRMINSALPIY